MYERKKQLEKMFNNIIDYIEKYVSLIFCLFLIIIFFVYLRYIKIIEDQNFYYYLFSTIIQGFLAVVGVLGTAIIYKIQLIENDLNLTKEKSISKIKFFVSSDYEETSWLVVKTEIDKLAIETENKHFILLATEFNHLSEHRELVKKDIVRFSLIAFMNVGMAIFGLPLSVFLTNNKYYNLISLFAFINIIFSLYLLFFSFKMITAVFSDKRYK